MATQAEETQAKEFLKRAEIRTMRKDLQALREVDALKERDKIAKLKTLEEQLAEKPDKSPTGHFDGPAPISDPRGTPASLGGEQDMESLKGVLEKNAGQERVAEKDLKNYATEEERQQIFLLESQRLSLEKQIDTIDQQKDPALKLEKNRLLLQKREQETKLSAVLEQERKLQDEEKFIEEKEQTTTIASQKKSLEQSKWDLDKKIQEIEKKRWEIEKQIGDIDGKISKTDVALDQNVTEKNALRDKVLGADKLLREIYSGVMAREEEKRRGLAQEQIARKEALSKARTEEKENIQRQQWTHSAPSMKARAGVPVPPAPVKRVVEKKIDVAAEEEQRKKFLQDVEEASKNQ